MKKLIITILALLILAMPCFGALNFVPGSTQYVTGTGDHSSDTEGTICGWIIRESINATQNFFWHKDASAGNYDNGVLFGVKDSNYLHFQIKVGGSFSLNCYGSTTINAATLYFVAVTVDSNGNKLWVNAQEETETYLTGDAATQAWFNSPSGQDASEIGRISHTSGSVYYMDGILFDVRIYNRALSQTEIGIIYSQHGNDGIIYGLVSRWQMNEKKSGSICSGAGAVKSTTGANDGTPAGNPVYASSPVVSTDPIFN